MANLGFVGLGVMGSRIVKRLLDAEHNVDVLQIKPRGNRVEKTDVLAVLSAPQAAILAVGRIADRVVPVDGQPAVRPTLILTLSCDHRVMDGARAARFLDDLANLIQEPWGLLA